ncbi:MAG: NAD(P)-binding domain-containing protein [Aestuariivirga sp.]
MSCVGFIGTGHLAGFFVEGLSRVRAPYKIVVSPRNAAKSADLARDFGVAIAPDNQTVVDQSDLVVVSVLPQDAIKVLEPLRFREGQTVLSVMAGVGLAQLKALTTPATPVLSLMPGMANVFNVGPSVMFPENKVAMDFLAWLGPIHSYSTERQFTAASVMGAFSGMSVLMMRDAINWFEAQGLNQNDARRLVAETLEGNSHTLLESCLSMDDIARGVVTPGGITELGRKTLDAGGSWADALDAVFQRVSVNPPSGSSPDGPE